MDDIVELKFTLPMPYIGVTKKLMSMNLYRNMFYQALNNFKKKYAKQIADIIDRDKRILFDHIDRLEYQLNFVPTKKGNPKKVDLVNIGSMVDKVFSDVLVSLVMIDDDSIEFVDNVSFKANCFAEETNIEVTVRGKVKEYKW